MYVEVRAMCLLAIEAESFTPKAGDGGDLGYRDSIWLDLMSDMLFAQQPEEQVVSCSKFPSGMRVDILKVTTSSIDTTNLLPFSRTGNRVSDP